MRRFKNMGYDVLRSNGMGIYKIDWTVRYFEDGDTHYHCWIPNNLEPEDRINMFVEFRTYARADAKKVYRQATKFSYDFIPYKEGQ